MRKWIALSMVVLMLIMCFAGCGGETAVADGTNVIDVFAGVDITKGYYTGLLESAKDGSGHYWDNDMKVDLDKISYDKSNADVKKFLKDINIYIVEDIDHKLHNGDVITIGLEYSKAQAEELGISLLAETKQVTVDWLKEVYRDSSEVDMQKVKAICDGADPVQCALNTSDAAWYANQSNHTYTSSQRTYFEYEADGNGDKYIAWVLVLVTLTHEYDYEGEHCQDTTNTLVRLELDKSDTNFDYRLNEGVYDKKDVYDSRYLSVERFQKEHEDYAVDYGWHVYSLSRDGELAYLEGSNEEAGYIELEEFIMN